MPKLFKISNNRMFKRLNILGPKVAPLWELRVISTANLVVEDSDLNGLRPIARLENPNNFVLHATPGRPDTHLIQGWLTNQDVAQATTNFSALLKRISQVRKPALSSKRTHADTGMPSSPMRPGFLVPRSGVWS